MQLAEAKTIFLSPSNLKKTGGVLFFVASFIGAYSGYVLFTPETAILPASGIILGGIFVGGLILWPVALLGTMLGYVAAGASLTLILLLSVVQTILGLVGSYLLVKLEIDSKLNKLRDMISFVAIIFIVSTIVPVALKLVLPFFLPIELPLTWGELWVSTIFTTLTVSPLIIRWSWRPHQRTADNLLEALGALGLTTIVAALLFWNQETHIESIPLVYILIAPLIWIALRIGPRFMTLSIFVIGVLVITGTYWGGTGFSSEAELIDYLFQTELLAMFLAVISFILVSTEEERKDANLELQGNIESLEQGIKEVHASEREKIEFIAILAHELRNPLSPIISSLDFMALKGPRHDEVPRQIEIIDTHIRTITRLLDDLLDITRISRKRFTLQKEPVELQMALRRSLETVQSYIDNKHHKLVVDLPQEPIWIEADMVRLTQIFVNILFNAAKYTDPGGTITVRCEQEDGMVAVHIEDNGVGIPSEMLTQIFRPFTRVNQTLARAGTGLGIGLSLTKQLTRMHGGTIHAASKGAGRGSVFTVRMPVLAYSEETLASTGEPDDSPQSIVEGQRSVLVIDDNESAALGIARLLEHKGYRTEIALTGEQGLAFAERMDPDIILLDIGLPDIDGYELMQRFRQRKIRAKIIALTGYGQEEDKERTRKTGFDYHLTKPAGIADIEAAIRAVS